MHISHCFSLRQSKILHNFMLSLSMQKTGTKHFLTMMHLMQSMPGQQEGPGIFGKEIMHVYIFLIRLVYRN